MSDESELAREYHCKLLGLERKLDHDPDLRVAGLNSHAHIVQYSGELLNMRVPCASGLGAHFL